MTMTDVSSAITEKMQGENLSADLIKSFLRAVKLAHDGDDGVIHEDSIVPVTDIPDFTQLDDYAVEGKSALAKSVMIKLNGGLGTSMGLARAKSLLPVRDQRCFLEVIAKQVLHLREHYQSKLPLLFMNSFRTEEDTLNMLNTIPELASGQDSLPFSFLQNKVPKLDASNFHPASHASEPDLEWCPPGHGDIYIALKQSGILKKLINNGYEYAFVSNADNLGAYLDPNLLGYFANSNAPFLMEVADRTSADKKGGHIARDKQSGHLLLREVAQTRAEEIELFQDIERHQYFNTNSLWLNLPALQEVIVRHDGVIPLPIIVNRKTLDPTHKQSQPIIQLESAMGAAIEVFEGSQAIRIDRDRFLPVKKTSDLLLLMSDLYRLEESGIVVRHGDSALPEISLDEQFFGQIDDFTRRFPHGVPSLAACTKLSVSGDVRFGANIRLIGNVTLSADHGEPLFVENDTVVGEPN